jgi:universal stress protein A
VRKILCPVDFSAGSREALLRAAETAIKDHAELVLVHIAEPRTWIGMSEAPLPADAIQQMADDEQAHLDAAVAEARALGVATVTSHMLTGAPADAIVEIARADRAIDLIVMGTHGRTGLRHAVLGSVAEKVVRLAPCAVLVTRPRDVK